MCLDGVKGFVADVVLDAAGIFCDRRILYRSCRKGEHRGNNGNPLRRSRFAIGYQCGFAYIIALMINQFGNLFAGKASVVGLLFALAALTVIIYMLFFRKYREAIRRS